MAALPPIEIDVRADTAQAEAGLKGLQSDLAGVDRAAKKAGRAASGAMAPVNRLGGSMRGTAMHTANLTAQFNDIGVMMAAGQSPLQLAMQQGTQINQVFQQMGGSGRDALRSIGSGLVAMVNPMSLLTIGTIAGGAALFQWARNAWDAGDSAEEAEEALERFHSAIGRVGDATDIGSKSISDLRKEYGAFAEQVQFTSRIVAQAALAESMREFSTIAGEMQEPLNGVGSALAEYQRRVEILSAVQDTLGEKTVSNASAYNEYEDAVDDAREAVVAAASDLGLTVRQAELLQGVLDRMANAEGPEQIAEQAGYALEIFDAMFTTASNIPPEVAQLVAELRAVQLAASQASADIESMADAARTLTPLPMTTGGLSGQGLSLPGGEVVTGGQLLPPGEDDGRGGGGGRGGRAAPRDTTADDLERLQTQLATETELIAETYATRLELLRQAREAEYLTKAEFDELELRAAQDKEEQMKSLREQAASHEINMRKKTSDSVIGLLQNLGQRNEKFAKAAVILNAAKAIRETIQNTAAASVRALAELGPILGPPAAAKINAYGAVQAGIIGANAALSLGGGGGGGSGAAPPTLGGGGGEGAQAPSITQNRSLTLIGDNFNRKQAIDIAEYMNEGTDNGLIIRGRA